MITPNLGLLQSDRFIGGLAMHEMNRRSFLGETGCMAAMPPMMTLVEYYTGQISASNRDLSADSIVERAKSLVRALDESDKKEKEEAKERREKDQQERDAKIVEVQKQAKKREEEVDSVVFQNKEFLGMLEKIIEIETKSGKENNADKKQKLTSKLGNLVKAADSFESAITEKFVADKAPSNHCHGYVGRWRRKLKKDKDLVLIQSDIDKNKKDLRKTLKNLGIDADTEEIIKVRGEQLAKQDTLVDALRDRKLEILRSLSVAEVVTK